MRIGEPPVEDRHMIESAGWKHVVIMKAKFDYCMNLYGVPTAPAYEPNKNFKFPEVQTQQGLDKPVDVRVPEHWERLQGPGLYEIEITYANARHNPSIHWYSYTMFIR
jgi:hypothetical protein